MFSLFPKVRPRRLRKNKVIRDLVSETVLSKSKLIQPLFISDSIKEKKLIETMPNQYIFSKDDIFFEIEYLLSNGISSFALFPNIDNSKKRYRWY